MTIKELIKVTVEDLAVELCYYGRKEDENLSREIFDAAVVAGDVSENEIASWFHTELFEQFRRIRERKRKG